MKSNIKKLLVLALLPCFMAVSLSAQTNALTNDSDSATNDAIEKPVSPLTAIAPITPVLKNTKPHHGLEKSDPFPNERREMSDNLRMTLVAMSPFVMITFIVGMAFFVQHRRHKVMNDVLRAMIDKGMPVTPEVIESLKSKGSLRSSRILEGDQFANVFPQIFGVRKNNDLRNGLIWTGIGMGVFLVVGKVGFILIFLGIAFIICSILQRKTNGDDGQSPKP